MNEIEGDAAPADETFWAIACAANLRQGLTDGNLSENSHKKTLPHSKSRARKRKTPVNFNL
jgi:hypothetical protein